MAQKKGSIFVSLVLCITKRKEINSSLFVNNFYNLRNLWNGKVCAGIIKTEYTNIICPAVFYPQSFKCFSFSYFSAYFCSPFLLRPYSIVRCFPSSFDNFHCREINVGRKRGVMYLHFLSDSSKSTNGIDNQISNDKYFNDENNNCNKEVEEIQNFKNKLKYRSLQRGFKELDLLLSEFTNEKINFYNKDELNEFEKILNYENVDLMDILFYRKKTFFCIDNEIRKSVENRSKNEGIDDKNAELELYEIDCYEEGEKMNIKKQKKKAMEEKKEKIEAAKYKVMNDMIDFAERKFVNLYCISKNEYVI